MIDMRSDTVTHPTAEMRRAMFEAAVGDDVYGEDPTVNALQELAAQMLGKEAALFVPSGTQGNLISILAHCPRSTEIIVEQRSHIFNDEGGAASSLGGVQLRTLQGRRGALDPEEVRSAIRETDIHDPPTSLICVENTHNRAGGTVIPLENLQAIRAVAREHGIPVHMDGARIFNAQAASGVPAREIAACADSVQFCLSKGLAAPVGSVVVGTKAWIEKALWWRKRMGGGMRQAGIIAAAGIVALRTMVERLAEDHAAARYLGEELAGLPGIDLDLDTVQTNMVVFGLTEMTAESFIARMRSRGVLVGYFGARRVRMTTHKDVTRDDVETVLAAARSILAGSG